MLEHEFMYMQIHVAPFCDNRSWPRLIISANILRDAPLMSFSWDGLPLAHLSLFYTLATFKLGVILASPVSQASAT